MSIMTASEERARNLRYFHQPELWPLWPWLPVVRRSRGKEELGVLCDLKNLHGLTGYSATVFYANLFALPDSVGAFPALPRKVHDTPEEIYEAGWRVDQIAVKTSIKLNETQPKVNTQHVDDR